MDEGIARRNKTRMDTICDQLLLGEVRLMILWTWWMAAIGADRPWVTRYRCLRSQLPKLHIPPPPPPFEDPGTTAASVHRYLSCLANCNAMSRLRSLAQRDPWPLVPNTATHLHEARLPLVTSWICGTLPASVRVTVKPSHAREDGQRPFVHLGTNCPDCREGKIKRRLKQLQTGLRLQN